MDARAVSGDRASDAQGPGDRSGPCNHRRTEVDDPSRMTTRWDPTIQHVPDDRPTGGGSHRVRKKPWKDEAKYRTNGWSVERFIGWLATTRDPNGTSEDFTDFASLSGGLTAARAELDPAGRKAELNLVDGQASVAAVKATLVPGDPIEYVPTVKSFVAPGPFAARVSDPTVHGTPLAPGIGSTNVFIGGLPAFRARIDYCLCPLVTPLPHVGGRVLRGADSVRVNGFPLVRAGDVVVETGGGPNPVAMGCPRVKVGKPAPPVDMVELVAVERDDTIDVLGFIEIRPRGPLTAEAFYVDATLKAGANADLNASTAAARTKAELQAGVARVAQAGEIIVHLPFVDRVLRIGGRGSVAVACTGGELDSSVEYVDGKLQPKIGRPVLGSRPLCTDGEISWAVQDDPSED